MYIVCLDVDISRALIINSCRLKFIICIDLFLQAFLSDSLLHLRGPLADFCHNVRNSARHFGQP